MTDPFSDLGRHLHRAARRRARINRARPVAGAVALMAAGVLAIAAIGAVRLPGDEEVAVPGPKPTPGSCSSSSPPPVIAETFSVFEGDVAAPDRLPEWVAERVSADLPGGRMAKVWADHGRRAREGTGRRYWVVPALAGSCASPRPAVCVVYEAADLSLPACVEVADVGDGVEVTTGSLGPGRWFRAALVPDTTELGMLDSDRIGSYRPSIEGNIFEVRYSATSEQHEAARVEFVSREESERSAERGGCPGYAVSVTDAPPAAALLRELPMFERGDPKLTPGFWIHVLGGHPQRVVNLHAEHDRALGSRGDLQFTAAAVAHLPGTKGCAPVRDPEPATDRPGVCVVASRGDGAGTERFPGCWTLEEVRAGEAFELVSLGERDVVLYAVLPAGATDATVIPNEGPPVRLEAEEQVHFALSHNEVLQPGFVLRYTNAHGEQVTGTPSMAPLDP